MVVLNISFLSLELRIILLLVLIVDIYQVQSEKSFKNSSANDSHKKDILQPGIHGTFSLANKSSIQDQVQ